MSEWLKEICREFVETVKPMRIFFQFLLLSYKVLLFFFSAGNYDSTFGNSVLGSFCFALCCNHMRISITILQDLLQIMKEIGVEDIAFAICSLSFRCLRQ